MNVFTEEFLKIDNSKIVKEIREKGFFSFENALTSEFINNIISDVKTADIGLNKNNVAGVYLHMVTKIFLLICYQIKKFL